MAAKQIVFHVCFCTQIRKVIPKLVIRHNMMNETAWSKEGFFVANLSNLKGEAFYCREVHFFFNLRRHTLYHII